MFLSNTDLRDILYWTSAEEPFRPLVECPDGEIPDYSAIQPASIDLRLSPEIKIWRGWIADPRSKTGHRGPEGLDAFETFRIPDDGMVVNPGAFILGSTLESVNLPNHIVASVEGKSSLARLGLTVHQTAGWVDPGFSGTIVLELIPNIPIVLYPEMFIAQIVFGYTQQEASPAYGDKELKSHYQYQTGPTEFRP